MTRLSSYRCCVLMIAAALLIGRSRMEVEGRGFDGSDATEVYKLLKSIIHLETIREEDPKNVNKIIDFVQRTNSKLDDLSNRFDEVPENIFNTAFFMDHFILIEAEAIRFESFVVEIKSRYNRMMSMLQNIDGYDSSKIDFVKKNVNTLASDSMRSQLFNVFFLYFGYQQKIVEKPTRIPLIDKILLEFQYAESHNLCPTVSAQQHFYNDYLGITILEIKGYLVETFCWAVLSYLEDKEFTREKYFSRVDHERRLLFMIYKVRKALGEASRELRTCDPDNWEEKVNYEQLTRLFQGYIANENDLRRRLICVDDCSKYVTKINNRNAIKQSVKSRSEILSCEADFSRDSIAICPSDNPARRYDYIDTNHGCEEYCDSYGKRTNCSKTETLIQYQHRGISSCNICFCLIDENNEKSDRFFNLRETLSDVSQNKVVTGVRFTKKNRVIYLQIQQGELSSFGLINRTSIEWKDVDEYELEENNDGVDYVTLHNNLKSINLDDIEVDDPNYIVTGVKLSVADSFLYMEILLTEFEYQTGKLVYPALTSKWISSSTKHEVKVPLNDRESDRGPDVSTRAPEKSSPTPAAYDVVEFTHSDKIYDASQTTLPFIDAQDVVSELPTPLSGVGLYHKGFKGYGGFIALKIFNLDFSGYI